MFAVDTNVLVHAANVDAPEHPECWALLQAWRHQVAPWHVSWNVLYEFVRVVTHPRVLRRPMPARQAWEFVDVLLQSPGLRVLHHAPAHAATAAQLATEVPRLVGNLVHDAHTVALMRDHGIRRIYTRDADFHRFAGIVPVDPLAP